MNTHDIGAIIGHCLLSVTMGVSLCSRRSHNNKKILEKKKKKKKKEKN
jgi:hypothetical protein